MQYWYTYIDYLCSGIVSREALRGVEHFAWTQALIRLTGESGYGDIHPHAGTICFSVTNSGVFVYLLKGIFPLRDHLDVFLAKFDFLSTEQRFMCWCSAMNLVFVYFLFDGGHMNVDQSQGRKSVDPQPFKTDSPSSFFLFCFCNGLLLERFWQGANILEDSVLSQSSPPHV